MHENIPLVSQDKTSSHWTIYSITYCYVLKTGCSKLELTGLWNWITNSLIVQLMMSQFFGNFLQFAKFLLTRFHLRLSYCPKNMRCYLTYNFITLQLWLESCNWFLSVVVPLAFVKKLLSVLNVFFNSFMA